MFSDPSDLVNRDDPIIYFEVHVFVVLSLGISPFFSERYPTPPHRLPRHEESAQTLDVLCAVDVGG